MMKQLSLISLLVLIVSNSWAAESDSVGFKKDLRIFRDALERTHPDLYRFTPKDKFDVVFDSIDNQITHKTSLLEFYRLISRIESLVREGHTYLQPPGSLLTIVQMQKLFPFQVSLSSKNMVINKSLLATYVHYEGLEIESINGRSVAKTLSQIASSTGMKSGYNDSALLDILSFDNNFAVAYYIFADTASTFRIKFRGIESSVYVDGIRGSSQGPFPKFSKEPDPPMSLEINETHKTALLKITTFAYWTISFSKREYTRTFLEYFERISNAGVNYLILDVRNNRGGEELLAGDLLTYLLNSEFRLYSYVKAKTLNFDYNLPGATKFQFSKKDYIQTDSGYFMRTNEVLRSFFPKRKHHFNGKIYILSNGGSRSATSTMLALIRTHKIATIIGQESGGVYNDVDGRKRISLTLPFSGIQMSFPAWSFRINSGGGDRFRGVVPDYIVTPDKQALLEGRDSELELAYKLIGGK